MSKVKCKVCANEVSGICTIKKVGVSTNKPRICEAYTYDEHKVKVKQDIPITRFGYKEQQEYKRRVKAELKAASKRAANKLQTDQKFTTTLPADSKHPLTGDLSRFTTTATKNEE